VKNEIELPGGNMSNPVLRENMVYKQSHSASHTIHDFLNHLERRGISWIPHSFGINEDGEHVLSYIRGEVVHDAPKWLFDNTIRQDAAEKLRIFHDSSLDFPGFNRNWRLEPHQPVEVICHNDFAPYNFVFEGHKAVGVIDFDTCSPGSRIWDLSYAAYRFIPITPDQYPGIEKNTDVQTELRSNIQIFLEHYSQGDAAFLYDNYHLLATLETRLQDLAEWTKNYAVESNNPDLVGHAEMYLEHGEWVKKIQDVI
jgi:hypothetical protein